MVLNIRNSKEFIKVIDESGQRKLVRSLIMLINSLLTPQLIEDKLLKYRHVEHLVMTTREALDIIPFTGKEKEIFIDLFSENIRLSE